MSFEVEGRNAEDDHSTDFANPLRDSTAAPVRPRSTGAGQRELRAAAFRTPARGARDGAAGALNGLLLRPIFLLVNSVDFILIL